MTADRSTVEAPRELTDAVIKAARDLVTIWNIYRDLDDEAVRELVTPELLQQLKLATIRLKNRLTLLDEGRAA